MFHTACGKPNTRIVYQMLTCILLKNWIVSTQLTHLHTFFSCGIATEVGTTLVLLPQLLHRLLNNNNNKKINK